MEGVWVRVTLTVWGLGFGRPAVLLLYLEIPYFLVRLTFLFYLRYLASMFYRMTYREAYIHTQLQGVQATPTAGPGGAVEPAAAKCNECIAGVVPRSGFRSTQGYGFTFRNS